MKNKDCDCAGCIFERLAFEAMKDFLEDAQESGMHARKALLSLAIISGRQEGRVAMLMKGAGLTPDDFDAAIAHGFFDTFKDTAHPPKDAPVDDGCFRFDVAPPGGIQ